MASILARNRICVVVVAGTLGISLVLSSGVLAQGDGGSTRGGIVIDDKQKDVKVTLNADAESVSQTLRALMKSAKADFVIDNDLKSGKATAHLTDVAFKDALATVIKVSTIPITYELKDGIYHFMLRVDPPVVEKAVEPAKPEAPKPQSGKIPVDQLSAADALRKLTLPYGTQPQMLYQHSTLPASHGSTSGFGFGGGGLLQSNGFVFNPDGSVTRTGAPPINVFGLFRALLGGFRR